MTKTLDYRCAGKTADAPMWAVAMLGLAPAVALGWARFAYGLLLPSMQHALHWQYVTAGSLATANGLGYLLGAVLTSVVARRIGLSRTLLFGIACAAAGLLGCAFAQSRAMWLLLQAGAGFGGALAFVIGATLVANAAATSRRAAIGLAVYVAGAGFGITVAAITVPPLLAFVAGWRWAWAVLAGFSAVGWIGVWSVLGRFPNAASQKNERLPLRLFARVAAPIAAAYGLFGLGYVGYTTFISALLHQKGVTQAEMASVWAALGAAAMAAAFIWGRIFPLLRDGRGLAAVLLVVLAGVTLPLVTTGLGAALLSALLFGGSMLAVPPAAAHFIRESLACQYRVSAMGLFTVCFGVGQIVGPVLVGGLADTAGGIDYGFAASAAILCLALVVALCQWPVARRTAESMPS